MITTLSIEDTLRKLKPTLFKDYSVQKVGYFGSYANDTFTSSSDLDIIVYFEKPLGWSFFDLKELLESELKVNVDLVSASALRHELRDQILKQTKFID
ncbi:MAG TPA: nucleotidyltransferase domain-containing protein [Fulvivirga sp.]|nr:nucleotidyltransferase domain-containing protein [Fulvivirga sp.]